MFNIHATDLRRRRARCRPVVQRLLQWERQPATRCNVCGSARHAILSLQDRYGFPARTAMCLDCGLVYVVDRFTAAGYAEFYKQGIYREMISRYKGKPQTIRRVHAAQEHYTEGLLRALQGFVSQGKGARLLDIGGSTGYVASQFEKRLGLRATIIEPAAEEVEAARKLGLDAHVASVEDYQTTEQFDVVLLCRTIEHVFDLRAAFTKIRSLLKPDGLFFCDIAEFMETCRREGPPEVITKIDHVFWLTQETAPGIFGLLGFEIAAAHVTLPPDQMGFLLRRIEPTRERMAAPGVIDDCLRQFRRVGTEWQRFGQRAYDPLDWLKRRAARVKKMLTSGA
jgi:SAM-dependent methyltransferase